MSGPTAAPPRDALSFERLLGELEAESAALFGNRDRIEEACAALRADLELLAGATFVPALQRLARVVASRLAAAHAPIVSLIADVSRIAPDPWPVLEGLLDANDPAVVAAALAALERSSPAALDPRAVEGIAARADAGREAFGDRGVLEAIAALLRSRSPATLESLRASGASPRLRRLAARLLDLDGTLPDRDLVGRVLGREDGEWLMPYLAWTRATHLDLAMFATGEPGRAIAALREAEATCGTRLLREIVAEIGWANLNLGLSVRRFAGVSVAGSFPLLMEACEAPLAESFAGAHRAFDRLLVTAHGGLPAARDASGDSAISRFREYNLAHAELLARFLDVAPLTVARVRDTIDRMDRIVADFRHLFARHTEECDAVGRAYAALRDAVERALAPESGAAGTPLSPELTRLVDMFDDPASPDEIRTLHGLKRYLHQRGLRLGMSLAETGRAANCTVTLALATPDRFLRIEKIVEYADFEPEESSGREPPHAVTILAEEFGRQLVHAQQPLPKVRIFCYGNEVHYFVAYRNHPAFIRIDYSPPGRGGMIDLAYFGVSKYELGSHPNLSLTALERFFRRIDFDVRIENTRVQARYDKERAFDLGELREKAAALFRLVPYLMEIDWVIGDLALSTAARETVAAAWAEFFASWGVLPIAQLLTRDRLGILAAVASAPAGEREVRWDPTGPYRDRFSVEAPAGFADHLRRELAVRGLEGFVTFDALPRLAQLPLERALLQPIRDARSRGEIEVASATAGLSAAEPGRFERRHPAECLARVLLSGEDAVARSAAVASQIAMLARGLRFRTVGTINGYEVQSASLPLPARAAGLHALRDESGIFRAGIWSPSDVLFVSRDGRGGSQESWSIDAEALARFVRRANYPAAGEPPRAVPGEAARILERVRAGNPAASPPPLSGDRMLDGVAASPGRAVGPARLGLQGRRPADLAGAILIAPSLAPEDGMFLAAAAGVVSTGGGALSHAGLLALQYGKPALVVQGAWEGAGSAPSALAYRAIRYEETRVDVGGFAVAERRDLRDRDERLREGDLVVLDAEEGMLRILGQAPAALALHDSLRQLEVASRQLSAAASDAEVLVARGRRLRALHQLERIVARLTDPILARHAVAELFLRDGDALAATEKRSLLEGLTANAAVGVAAETAIRRVTETIRRRTAAAAERAARLIPDASAAWEILSLRLDAAGLARVLDSAETLVAGEPALEASPRWDAALEALARARIETLRADAASQLPALARAGIAPLRHALEEIDRADVILGTPGGEAEVPGHLRDAVAEHDRTRLRVLGEHRILESAAGGIELRPLVGGKAANLAEMARLGEGACVPPWFVVTDVAFREAFASPFEESSGARSVRASVEETLARADLTNAQKAALIRGAWESARLSPALVEEVVRAYRRLGDEPFVAVRSSAREEDLEAAARAGEFDTFLFVRGEAALVGSLKRAWAGLWTERALNSRELLGLPGDVGGGVLVQRMLDARAAGVIHTVNVAERHFREMVINAGLGLGEGVVSGRVAADTVVVAKEGIGEGNLRFRYLTADKRERVVFNSRLGSGTAVVETLHHQRLRPALEYVEIWELVRAAARLEAAYRYPLDIEFAIEGTAVWLLQVRPLPTPFAAWRDTVERWPLGPEGRAGGAPAMAGAEEVA
ncbi:MAG TPA: PEP/pyruvate-binding domain-containing protein [Thermoanaerobaculia bacterium]